MCTINSMLSKNVICLDFLLAVNFVKAVGLLVMEYAKYDNDDDKYQPYTLIAADSKSNPASIPTTATADTLSRSTCIIS